MSEQRMKPLHSVKDAEAQQEQDRKIERESHALAARGMNWLCEWMRQSSENSQSAFSQRLAGLSSTLEKPELSSYSGEQLEELFASDVLYFKRITQLSKTLVNLWLQRDDSSQQQSLGYCQMYVEKIDTAAARSFEAALRQPVTGLEEHLNDREHYMFEYLTLLEHDVFSGGEALGKILQTLEFIFAMPYPEQEQIKYYVGAFAAAKLAIERQLAAYDLKHPLPDPLPLAEVTSLVQAEVALQLRFSSVPIGLELAPLQEYPNSAVVCSPSLVAQVLSNAISNARKGVEQQSDQEQRKNIQVQVRAVERAAQQVLQVVVLDSGDGFPEKMLQDDPKKQGSKASIQIDAFTVNPANFAKGKTEWRDTGGGMHQTGTGRGMAALQLLLSDLDIMLVAGTIQSGDGRPHGGVIVEFPLLQTLPADDPTT